MYGGCVLLDHSLLSKIIIKESVMLLKINKINVLTPARSCVRPTPDSLAFFGIFQSERKQTENKKSSTISSPRDEISRNHSAAKER